MSKSFLIVGASSDIALELGQRLLSKGHSVTLLARDTHRVQPLVDQGAQLIQGDALDKEVVQSAVDAAKENGEGSLAGVAHLVGSLVLRPPHALTLDAFNEVIHTNLSSAFLTLSIACKTMLRSGGGRLVFTSSVAATLGLMNHEAIAAAKGGVDGFGYSTALAEFGGAWDYQSLNAFLAKPKAYISGTKMNFAGLKKPADRANMIAYLRQQADSQAPLPTAEEIAADVVN